jgi:AraC-like DNA-binding protein
MVRSGRGLPSAAEAGRQLGMSERTLHRRLATQGLSFGAVLDQVREQRAVYLLDNSRLSIERIAESLGFAETASFSRAFKRWKGLSPLQFRRRAENEGRGSLD